MATPAGMEPALPAWREACKRASVSTEQGDRVWQSLALLVLGLTLARVGGEAMGRHAIYESKPGDVVALMEQAARLRK